MSNITISTVGANVTVQRQNLGETEIQGFQADAEYSIRQLALHGRLPLRPRHDHQERQQSGARREVPAGGAETSRHVTACSYADPKLATITFGVQFVGLQFDTGDDTNTRAVPGYSYPGLPAYAVSELTITRGIGRNVDVFFGAQNLFNQEYIVATLPTTIGSPTLVNARRPRAVQRTVVGLVACGRWPVIGFGPTTDHRPPTTDHRPLITATDTDHRPLITDRRSTPSPRGCGRRGP